MKFDDDFCKSVCGCPDFYLCPEVVPCLREESWMLLITKDLNLEMETSHCFTLEITFDVFFFYSFLSILKSRI